MTDNLSASKGSTNENKFTSYECGTVLECSGHRYSKILLRETLKRAKEKGINPVLVFHFADNIPACKMSESVGGKLVEERFHEKHGRFIRKYTFDTSAL